MKRTENDYYIEENTLNTANGARFLCAPRTVVLQSSDLSAVSFTEQAAAESITVVRFEGAFVGSADSYDEAFLASLRDKLKEVEEIEEANRAAAAFAIDILCGDVANKTADELIDRYYHCARRIKDCAAVCGFVLPKTADTELLCSLIDSLKKKHPEYVYFVHDETTAAELAAHYPRRIALLQSRS